MRRFRLALLIPIAILIAVFLILRLRSFSVKHVMVEAETLRLESPAAANGTFIQWWLVKDWNASRWAKEFQVMKEAGMEYVVLSPTAFYKSDESTNRQKIKTIYPSKLNNVEIFNETGEGLYPDIVDTCLRNAQETGLKVFLGLNFSDEWWVKRLDSSWIQDRMHEGNLLAEELWNLYHDKYPDAFYGWYWAWEVDNANFRLIDLKNSKKILADAIRTQLDYMENSGKRLPFMLSPYIDWRFSLPQSYAMMWEYVFTNSGMKEGDVFCPQDSIGAGGLNMKNYVNWFKKLNKAARVIPGLRFWVNIETFNISDWTAAPLSRFIRQLNELRPYVDDFITFAYSHYYSPNIVHPGFHKTYIEYLNTGALETIPPSAPTNIKASFQTEGKILLEWDASSDNVGVCGYYIYRNGIRIASIQVERKYYGRNKPEAVTKYIDKVPDANSVFTNVYQVAAYDFAGNLSEISKPVSVSLD